MAFRALLVFFLVVVILGGVLGAADTSYAQGAQLLSPINGAINVQVKGISFSWAPVAGATEYRFMLARDASMTKVVCEEWVTGTGYTYWGALDYSASYFWRVMVYKPAPVEWSPVFAFYTEPAPPPPPAPPPAKPDCQFMYPTIRYPAEGQRFDLYVGQKFNLDIMHAGNIPPGCKTECPTGQGFDLRCTPGLPAGLLITIFTIMGTPAPGAEGTYPLMLEVTVTDANTGKPCCVNYSRRNITLVVHPAGGGISPPPPPTPAPPPAPASPPAPPPVAQQSSYAWLVLLLIAAVVIGGGIFLYRRFAVARAVAPSAPVEAAPTSAKKAVAPKAAPKAKAADAKAAGKSNFCTKCGAPLKPGVNFCNKCGKKLIKG